MLKGILSLGDKMDNRIIDIKSIPLLWWGVIVGPHAERPHYGHIGNELLTHSFPNLSHNLPLKG